MRQLPNLICIARVALLWPTLQALAGGRFGVAAGCFALAGFSDLLDGYLAKRFNWTSELGKWLDPSADKLLLAGVFIAASVLGLVPVWLTLLVVGRDAVIALGALAFVALIGPLQGRPTRASKLNTLVQLAYLEGVMLCHALGWVPGALLTLGSIVTAATTLFSGLGYVIDYAGRLRRTRTVG
ncbi:MAG TPA: CDP-alcohol phosphatidyltransferase family protein [Steroidobacteraceae bacterium]|nr:CDP-alcohol phosphatidyltransferase family protein [Steroidobacteraceae bacterium]